MGPGQWDRDQAGVKAENRAAEVGGREADMEPARAATVFVQSAVRKPRTSRAFPVLMCNARSVELQWYGSSYLGLLTLSRRMKWFCMMCSRKG